MRADIFSLSATLITNKNIYTKRLNNSIFVLAISFSSYFFLLVVLINSRGNLHILKSTMARAKEALLSRDSMHLCQGNRAANCINWQLHFYFLICFPSRAFRKKTFNLICELIREKRSNIAAEKMFQFCVLAQKL
jgi:hypothetical protein